MASFKNLEMAAAVSNHPHISVRSAFFGLSMKAEYKPTQSAISALQQDYSDDNQFAALQLFSYSDFEYRPITDVVYYEGADAEIINTLFK